jgi:hypothetical protein
MAPGSVKVDESKVSLADELIEVVWCDFNGCFLVLVVLVQLSRNNGHGYGCLVCAIVNSSVNGRACSEMKKRRAEHERVREGREEKTNK